MPRVETAATNASPSRAPATYPGRVIDENCLLADSWTYRVEARPARRIGQWLARIDGGPLGPDTRPTSGTRHVNYALLMLNAAPMERRYPMLAIGSNASPGQIFHKFSSTTVSKVIPMSRAAVSGLTVGHSPHVSGPGYIPFIPIAGPPDQVRHLFVLWLDAYQLDAMTATEPNYDLVRLDGSRYPAVLDSGESLPAYGVYRGKWGALRLSPDDSPLERLDQVELFERLSSQPWFADLVPGDGTEGRMERLRDDNTLRDAVRAAIAARGLVAADGLQVDGNAPDPYGELLPEVAQGYVIHPSPPRISRRGEHCVVLSPDTAERLGAHTLVSNHQQRDAPTALAKVVVDGSGTADHVARLDQTVRNGIGVEIGEIVHLEPAVVRGRRWADLALSPRSYVTCRVQVASLFTVEQQVCMVDPITLEMLGVESGDEVVIEGIPGPGETVVPTCRIKSYATPAEVTEKRERLAGGDLSTRYPASSDALGVYPDLAWVFLDNEIRAALGVNHDKLAVVRLRASRRYQVAKEVREILLLLVLAFIGLISILTSDAAVIAATAGLVVLALATIHRRLRQRLSHRQLERQRPV